MPADVDLPRPGLRERKKAKTRAAIQQHALRLFREQGYDATTIEQIADAAEVSPSTFFRYFPTKEDVALYDALDPLVFAAFQAQPPELSPVRAMREAMREVVAGLSPEELRDMEARMDLIRDVPELRARTLDEYGRAIDLMTELVANRTGCRADDLAVRALAGAVVGVSIAIMLTPGKLSGGEMFARIDAALELMEEGFPLAIQPPHPHSTG